MTDAHMYTAVLSAVPHLIDADTMPLTVALLPTIWIWHLAFKSRGYTSTESDRGILGRVVRRGLMDALPVTPKACTCTRFLIVSYRQ